MPVALVSRATALAAGALPAGAREEARLGVAWSAAVLLRPTRARVGFAVVYHRVDCETDDPARRIVPALASALFEAQVRHLGACYQPVRASELLDAIQDRRRGAAIPVAVTFDDDLDTHARVAAPILAGAGVPATFYLSGSGDGDGPQRWWEDLQTAVDARLLGAESLGSQLARPLGEALAGTPWALHALARDIVRFPERERAAVVTTLRTAVAGLPPAPSLTPQEVRGLTRQGFEIGFHTRRHHPLPSLDDAALAEAMTDGRPALESVAAQPARTIAYPHGQADGRVVRAAASAGFQAGFTTAARAIGPGAEPLLLGRIPPSFSSLGHFALTIARELVRVSRPVEG